ncbi:dTDP-4-dehydrorhamnose reductase [Caldimonas brevitalea]|uniref:dTDP-4-dehydrorhamnose reductase n=2 Tax=Caldimonas brevitalea TaxID=413882 RepID=A0A0G3BNV5_9BURK|nr:dTDP-4-dehydrorhamnose reductase [Caldimonas brevitalea]
MELWGGLECTVNRVEDQYFSQMERNGHAMRPDDLERFASLGIRAIRYPVLWERTAPGALEHAQWAWSDARLNGLRQLGVSPIVGLVHHGSGPQHTSLVDPGFATGLAAFAAEVARRYPWVERYTPVNEPLTTARFSGLYGVWYPHARSDRSFVRALLHQCRAVVLSMQAIRSVNPRAQLVQTEDLGKTYSTPALRSVCEFYNHRRWLSWDLLCGKVDRDHALWDYLMRSGATPAELLWFQEHRCPPDILGINYYITGERWLDEHLERYPARYHGGNGEHRFADIETPRAFAVPTPGVGALLQEAWDRYRLPIAVTEAHIDAHREDQLRWLVEIWRAAQSVRQGGADVRAVTVWALLGSYDWNSLVTCCKGYYEPGPFDVRSAVPRPTALARLMQELSAGGAPSHPVLDGPGWWRRPGRFLCEPVVRQHEPPPLHLQPEPRRDAHRSAILVTGADGRLGSAFVRLCAQRSLACHAMSRAALDITDVQAVEAAVARYRPWAIVNAAGMPDVDRAEADPKACEAANAVGAAVVARVCAAADIPLLTFSSEMVFDGRLGRPYVETDVPAPLNTLGRSKVEAERAVLGEHARALVVRTSALFGPWDGRNVLVRGLQALARGEVFRVADDVTVSPTYVPDLVHTCLDLLIDGEAGLWHLTNGQPVTWWQCLRRAAQRGGLDTACLQPCCAAELAPNAPVPSYSALSSVKAVMLPPLEDALNRFWDLWAAQQDDRIEARSGAGCAAR